MRSRVKTRPALKVERDPSPPTRRSPMPPAVQPPVMFNGNGQPTLEGFRSDERWAVRAYGD